MTAAQDRGRSLVGGQPQNAGESPDTSAANVWGAMPSHTLPGLAVPYPAVPSRTRPWPKTLQAAVK